MDRRLWLPFEYWNVAPMIVWPEWLATLGYDSSKYRDDFKFYNWLNRETQKYVKPAENLSALAMFFNPTHNWHKKDLICYYEEIHKTLDLSDNGLFEIERLLEKYPNWKPGLPTSSLPSGSPIIPVTMIVGFFMRKKQHINKDITVDGLKDMYIRYRWSLCQTGVSDAMIRSLASVIGQNVELWNNLYNFSFQQRRKVCLSTTPDILRQRFYDHWFDKFFQIEKYKPENEIDAVLITAIYYGIDISMSSEPMSDYINIMLMFQSKFGLPRSSVWSKLEINNSKDKDVNKWLTYQRRGWLLNQELSSWLPIEVYPNDVAENIAIYEGRNSTPETRHIPYGDFLIQRQGKRTFRRVIPYKIKSDNTYIYKDDIYEIGFDNLLAFGSDNEGWFVVSYKELQDYFNSADTFTYPDGKVIDAVALYKLEKLCLTFYPEMKRTLDKIKNTEYEKKASGYFILKKYKDNSVLIKCFLCLIYISMIWRVEYNSPPPENFEELEVGDYEFDISKSKSIDNQNKIDELSIKWLEFLYDNLQRNNAIDILDLPLINYMDGNFINNTDVERGLTIGDRLNIITNKGSTSIHACLRVSSNWILSSVAYYSSKINMNIPFDITKMERIC